VELSLHKLPARRLKRLIHVSLFVMMQTVTEMLRDVNKPSNAKGRHCMSPIHRN